MRGCSKPFPSRETEDVAQIFTPGCLRSSRHLGPVLTNPSPSAEDRITPKLAALHAYQLAIPAPKPPERPFNFAAERDEVLFDAKAQCARCHVPPLFTEPGWNAHAPADVCVGGFQADRAPDRVYRTAPLAGLFAHQKGGFYHDGRFATLPEVVNHYDGCMNLQLSDDEKSDLVQYLLTL